MANGRIFCKNTLCNLQKTVYDIGKTFCTEGTIVRNKYLAVLLCILLLIMTACGGKDMAQGRWDADTFTNDWAGLQFTLSEGCTALGAEQIRSWTKNDSAMCNDPAQKMDLSEAGVYYDCIVMLAAPQCSVQIIYENMENLPDMDAAAYAKVLQTGFAALTAAEYVYVGEKEAIIADQPYDCHTWEVNDAVIQRIYLRRTEDAMLCITTSCPKEETGVVDAFLATVHAPGK